LLSRTNLLDRESRFLVLALGVDGALEARTVFAQETRSTDVSANLAGTMDDDLLARGQISISLAFDANDTADDIGAYLGAGSDGHHVLTQGDISFNRTKNQEILRSSDFAADNDTRANSCALSLF